MKTDIREWKVIWHFFRPHKIKSLIVLLTMFLSGLFEMLNLAVLYPIINYGLDLEKKNFVLENFEKAIAHTIPDNPFLASCVLLIIVSVLAVVFKFIYKWCSNKLMIQIVKDNQKKILERFIAAEYNFYIKNQQGKLIYAGTTASERTGTAIFTVITLVYNVITALFLFFLLVLLSWQATIAILLVGLFYAFVIKTVMDKFIYKCTRISVEESQRRNVILNELITGIKTIKIFLAFDEWRKRHTAAVDRGLDNKFLMLTGRVFPEVFVKFVFYILIALTGIVLSQQSHHEVISLLPLFGTFAVVVNRFIPFAHLIGSGVMQIAEFMPDTKIAYDLCKEEFSVSFDGKKALEGFTDKISFENVKFKYTNMENVLLKNISFSVERRKMTALVGYSGSGKTTIINLLLKLYRPDQGNIKIDGVDIFELSNKSYLSRIGYVSQETFIFNSTFKENIRFGMEECTNPMIEEAAKLANAHEFIIDTKDGYDTIVGDAGVKLSGGQRQRIAIARAMLRKPEIIVLDEATSSLDNISEKKIQIAINNISKHTTVLVIAHRLSTVQNADKIIIIEGGEIKEQGTHQELLENKDVYYHLHTSKDAVEEVFSKEKIL